MTWECTWVQTHTPPLTTWLQHTQLLDIWLAELKARTQNIYGQSLFIAKTFDDLDRCKINSCGTVWPYRKDMPRDFRPKQLELTRGDVREGLTALVWKDRQEVYMLTNMDPPQAEGNFCDENNRSVKPHIVERYNRHMGFVNIPDRMANSYSMSRHNFKFMKLFSPLWI